MIVRRTSLVYRFEHMDYYPNLVTVVDCRYINFNAVYEKVCESVEMCCHKLVRMNGGVTAEDVVLFLMGKISGFRNREIYVSFTEEDIRKVVYNVFAKGIKVLKKGVETKSNVVWKGDGLVFNATDEQVKKVYRDAEKRALWFGSKKARYLFPSEKKKYINKCLSDIKKENRLDYYYKHKAMANGEEFRNKVMPIIQDMQMNNQAITVAEVAKKSFIKEHTVKYYFKNLNDLSEAIKKHNETVFGTNDNRKNRRLKNIQAICDFIAKTKETNKVVVAEGTSLALSTVYNLWGEDEVQRTLNSLL